ncbi:MAG: response regulator [Myxococcota bacterium]
MAGDKKQLGKILLKQRLVTQQELDELLELQRRQPGARLASTAQRSGKVSGKDLLKALSEQHGLPGIDLGQVVIPLENLDLIPPDISRQHLILPILVKEDRIFLAMADPTDRRVIDEIEFVTGRRVFPYVALHDLLTKVIDDSYRLREKGKEHYIGPEVPADYLASLGIETKPKGVVADLSMPEPDDDLGIRELEARAAPPRDTHEPFASQVAPLPTAPVGERPANPKILIVDDEDDIRKLLVRVMTSKGFRVSEASKGLEALQKVRDDPPDVILLDAMLPEVHGFDICRRIKHSKRYGHIPIIMVSAIYRGWRVAEDLKTSYGVDAFLEKPFKVSDVVNHVERALIGRTSEVPPDEAITEEASKTLEEGMAAYRDGNLDLAIEKLQKGIQIDPLSFQLHYHLGLLQGRRDQVFEAIQQLETAVDLQPKNFSALKNLAVLYQRAGFRHKAVEMWERALGAAKDDETRQGIKEHLMNLL